MRINGRGGLLTVWKKPPSPAKIKTEDGLTKAKKEADGFSHSLFVLYVFIKSLSEDDRLFFIKNQQYCKY